MAGALLCVVLASVWMCCRGSITLEHLSTVYLPIGYDPLTYAYDVDAAEQCALDTRDPFLYVTGGGTFLHIVDFSDPSMVSLEGHIEVPPGDGSVNDVETCQDWVAVIYSSPVQPLVGRALVYSRYNGTQGSMQKLHDVEVGAIPDSLKFTSDCSKVLVAIEGELVNNNGTMVDPEGGVSVVEFEGGQPGGGEPQVTFVDFTRFNDVSDDYIARGVRKIYNGEHTDDIHSTNFSQDLEPGSLVINPDNTLAYMSLQENNAIAVLDIPGKQFVDIYPLGYKDYSEGKRDRMDASDRDGGAHIKNWGEGTHGLFGMYQPDGIMFFSYEGKQYIGSSNEGDVKGYEDKGLDSDWSEAMRGRDLLQGGHVSSNVSAGFRALLSDEALLGRLTLSRVDGLDEEGRVQHFMAYGGRSFSFHRASDLSVVWDSGDELETQIYAAFPQVFNGNGKADLFPHQTFDSRSDNKGPEPHSIDYGVVNGKTVVFVGVERPGMVVVYSVVPGSDLELQFESIHYSGGLGDTYENLWEQRIARDLSPEDFKFVPADGAPHTYPLLVVAGEVSGTISFYEVKDNTTESNNTTDSASVITGLGKLLTVYCIFCVFCIQ